jgi:uridine kinase
MKKPFVIGIAGGTQSGKSTFTKALQNALQDIKIKTFHIDKYHKPQNERPLAEAPVTKKVYTDSNQLDSFNLPQLRIDLKNEIDSNVVDLIIVEGVFILYDMEILNALDLKLYVETRADERALRYVERYSKNQGYDFILNSYLDLVRYRMDEYVEPTKWRADMILNGSMQSEHSVEMVKAYLLTKIT